MKRKDAADLVVVDADVWTGDREKPRAKALAAKDGELVAVGTNAQAEALVGDDTEVLELAGAYVCPGFVDAHTHVAAAAGRLGWLSLAGKNREEVLSAVRERAARGGWVLGRGWDESRWADARWLSRVELDDAARDVPAMLVRVDGHLLVANTAALDELNIPDGVPAIDRQMGVLREDAADRALATVSPGREEILTGLPRFLPELHALGITAVHDMVRVEGFAAWMRWQKGRPNLRVYANVYARDLKEGLSAADLLTGMGDDWLRLGGVKAFSDGSLGARTACLLKAYEDDRSTRGLLLQTPEKLRDTIREAHFHGFQLAVHAIGDRAGALVAKELAALEAPEKRHRIEHFELPTAEALDQARAGGLVASMQPNFVGQWSGPGGLYERRLGKRVAGNNPYREILKRGIPLAFGSDGMPYGPLAGIHAAVNAPFDSQRLTPEEALRAYTAGGACAASMEDRLGSLIAGKLADFVVLDRSPLTRPKEVAKIGVQVTVIGGHIAWESPTFAAE